MQRRILILTVVVISAALALAQTNTPQTPPSGAQTGSSAGAAQSTQPQTGMGMKRPGMQGDMMAQHMEEMKASVARMHALLNQMRSSYGSMDPKSQPAMQANIEMWQLMVDHMDMMMQHMQEMQGGMGMGMGGVHHRHDMAPQPPPTTPKPPTTTPPQ